MKLLDITEQPMGPAAAKKRKRQQDMEDAKRAAEEAATQVPYDTARNTARAVGTYRTIIFITH